MIGTFRALVFDLAGVLLEFDGPSSVLGMSGGRVDEPAFFRFWSEAACAHDLHCGRISPEEFAHRAVREWHLHVTPEAFLADYTTWFKARTRERWSCSTDCGRVIGRRVSAMQTFWT